MVEKLDRGAADRNSRRTWVFEQRCETGWNHHHHFHLYTPKATPNSAFILHLNPFILNTDDVMSTIAFYILYGPGKTGLRRSTEILHSVQRVYKYQNATVQNSILMLLPSSIRQYLFCMLKVVKIKNNYCHSASNFRMD